MFDSDDDVDEFIEVTVLLPPRHISGKRVGGSSRGRPVVVENSIIYPDVSMGPWSWIGCICYSSSGCNCAVKGMKILETDLTTLDQTNYILTRTLIIKINS